MNTANDHYKRERERKKEWFVKKLINAVKSHDLLYILYILKVVSYNLKMAQYFLYKLFKNIPDCSRLNAAFEMNTAK